MLKEARKAVGMSLDEASYNLNLSRGTLIKYEAEPSLTPRKLFSLWQRRIRNEICWISFATRLALWGALTSIALRTVLIFLKHR